MNSRKLFGAAIGALAAASAVWAGPAAEEAVRKALEAWSGAIVPVSAVIKIEAAGMPGGSQERPVEMFGTVVGPNGLTAVSATSLSPLNNMGEGIEMGGVRPVTSVSRIRIRLAEGVEIAARQVLTDEEMDLTFLAPEPEDGKPLPAFPKPIEFARDAAPGIADEILTLGRAGQMFNWAPVIGRAQVLGIVESPRRLYLLAGAFLGGVGTPLLTSEGRPFGLIVLRREPAEARPGEAPYRQAIVGLPAEDVAEALAQALRAAETPKKNAP